MAAPPSRFVCHSPRPRRAPPRARSKLRTSAKSFSERSRTRLRFHDWTRHLAGGAKPHTLRRDPLRPTSKRRPRWSPLPRPPGAFYSPVMDAIEVITLTDGGQSADDIAHRLAGFLRPAKSSLELALYDIRLPDPTGALVAGELREAGRRGVAPLWLYNGVSVRPSDLHPPPLPRPDILAELPIDARPVPAV